MHNQELVNYIALSHAQELLKRPFPVKDINWKPGVMTGAAKLWKRGDPVTKDMKALVMAYGDYRAYMNALDAICGPFWSVRYVTWDTTRLICELTIFGVTRSSTGEFDEKANMKQKDAPEGVNAEAQAFKRAAALFGLGRYLYSLGSKWATLKEDQGNLAISDEARTERDTWYAKVCKAWEERQRDTIALADQHMRQIMAHLLTGTATMPAPAVPNNIQDVESGEPAEPDPEPQPEVQPQPQVKAQEDAQALVDAAGLSDAAVITIKESPAVSAAVSEPAKKDTIQAPKAEKPAKPAAAPATSSSDGNAWDSWTGVNDAREWAKSRGLDEPTVASLWMETFKAFGKMNTANKVEVFKTFAQAVEAKLK